MSNFNDIKKNCTETLNQAGIDLNKYRGEYKRGLIAAGIYHNIRSQDETDKNKISNLINNNPNLKNKFFTAKDLLYKESKEISNINELKRKNEDNEEVDTKKHKSSDVYYYYESNDENEKLKDIMIKGKIGDQVHYLSNNQLGIKYYEITLNESNEKDLKLIGDYGGFFDDPNYLNDM